MVDGGRDISLNKNLSLKRKCRYTKTNRRVFFFKNTPSNQTSIFRKSRKTEGTKLAVHQKTQKRNHRETIKAMQLDKGDLQIDLTIKDKKLEVVTTQFDEVQKETVLLRNVSVVRTNKDGVAVYIGDDMYYIFNDEIVTGTREELLRIFQRVNVLIK